MKEHFDNKFIDDIDEKIGDTSTLDDPSAVDEIQKIITKN